MDPKPVQAQTPSQPQQQRKPSPLVCKKCNSPVWDTFYFCPNCGKKIKEQPYKFSWGRTIGVVLESALLPPLGFFPGIKYLKFKETGAKILGATAIIITVISTIIMVIFVKNFIDDTNKQLNDPNYLYNISNPQGSVQNQAEQLQRKQEIGL